MKSSFKITYQIVTEESAQDGCSAEYGWWMPGGWEYPLSAGPGLSRDSRLIEAQAGAFDLDLRTAIRSAIDLGAVYAIQSWGGSLSAQSVDPPCDRANIENGESRYYTFHVSGCSVGTIARIRRLLEGRL